MMSPGGWGVLFSSKCIGLMDTFVGGQGGSSLEIIKLILIKVRDPFLTI